jgi:hypothetical protein
MARPSRYSPWPAARRQQVRSVALLRHQRGQRTGRLFAGPSNSSLCSRLVPSSARVSAGIAPSPAPAAAATTIASRRATLPVAVAAVDRTVGRRLKGKLVDRLCAVRALQVEMPHVDHPSLSKPHSISFCSLRPPSTDCRRRSLCTRYRNAGENESTHGAMGYFQQKPQP